MFVEAGWISEDQGHAFTQESITTGKSIEDVIREHEVVTEDQFFALVAESMGTEIVDLSAFDGFSHTLHLLPGLAGFMALFQSGTPKTPSTWPWSIP